ncbi:hypothetical protein BS47DRAFT_1364569 [Hydnum rufescens UP504]|uniref:Uncharacterized protein n=1 Tax=Hydnum rufescens UP504 TaxID=1448309 RepID=A0A9P6AQW3_9AGAM|nr:hypothetical protein BS47DRAFT_1364569 [Hydnum rufescens UP504]
MTTHPRCRCDKIEASPNAREPKRECDMAAQCMGTRHGSATHGNATRQCDIRQHNMAVQCSSVTHGNVTQQRANDAIYSTAPNKDATASNDAPGITHPPQQVSSSAPTTYSHAKEQQKLLFLHGI